MLDRSLARSLAYRRSGVVKLVDALEVGDVLELEGVRHVHLLPDVLVHHVDVRLVHSAQRKRGSETVGGGGAPWIGSKCVYVWGGGAVGRKV